MLIDHRFAACTRRAALLLLLILALSLQSSNVYGTAIKGQQLTAGKVLSLTEAVQKIIDHNPTLEGFKPRFRLLTGLKQSANQAPGYQLGVDTENILGSGAYTEFDSAEITVSLGSVIELGDKRRYRTEVAHNRYQLEQAKLKVQTIDLLGAATQSFISLLVFQEQIKLAEQAVELATTTLNTIEVRFQKGAVFQAEAARAQVALAQAELKLDALLSRFQTQKALLSVLWGEPEPQFNHVSGDLYSFKHVKPYQQLVNALQQTPALQVYTDRYRVRDAELQLAQSASQSDIAWQVGIKQNQFSDDTGFSVGFTMPLFSQRRNQGAVTAAMAARESITFEQRALLLQLQAKLYQAYQIQQQQMASVKRLRTTILPALEASLIQTSKAYQSGRYSYIEWVGVQQEMLNARQMMIQAASNVLRNQSLIEQLTTQSLAATNARGNTLVKPKINQD